MRYEITSTYEVPEEMKELGMVRRVVIECGAVHLPLNDEIDAGGAVAHFNGFPFELKPGDRVRKISD